MLHMFELTFAFLSQVLNFSNRSKFRNHSKNRPRGSVSVDRTGLLCSSNVFQYLLFFFS